MAKKKVIRKFEGAVRGIEVIDKQNGNSFGIELPILGFIAAGSPIEPFTDPNATTKVASGMLSGKKRAFVLQVRGESMIEDGILDGDFVVIEEQEQADNGDIVVALLESGMATLKRYYREATRIKLAPANSKMSPIFVNNVRIQGKCVGIIRKF
jgi:repressor LexA